MCNIFEAGFILTGVLHTKVFAQLLFPEVRYIDGVFNLVYYVFCCVNNCCVLPITWVLQGQVSILVINVVIIRNKLLRLG